MFMFRTKFENGDFSIPAEILLEAIKICNATADEFFCDDLSKYAERKTLIDDYEKLSDNSKQTINDLMKNMK